MKQHFDVISPMDGRVVVSMPEATPSQIARSLDNAQQAYRSWRTSPLEDRMAIVEAFIAELERREAEIAETITACMGRPIRFSPGEVKGTAERGRAMLELAPEALQDIVPSAKDGFTRSIQRVPHGAVLVLSPWNYPYLTAINAIVPALLSGNVVLLKHSDQTPLAAEHFREAFEVAGLPDGVFQVLHMNHEATAQVLADDCIDHVAFTGSVTGGIAISKALAQRTGRKRFIGAGLELGGNDPAYVRADADIGHAAANVIEGALFNSGQSCCAVERIYVDESIADTFIDRCAEEARQYVLGDQTDPATTLGPVVRQRNADAIRAQITAALEAGAHPHIDTAAFDADRADRPYLAPQILTNVDHNMDFVSEETFGPCVGIMRVQDDAQAIERMNHSSYGLTASIWTSDEAAAQRIGDALDTGTVFMNRCDYLDPHLAWTGTKNSGRGSTLSQLGFEHMTRAKSFHLRTKV